MRRIAVLSCIVWCAGVLHARDLPRSGFLGVQVGVPADVARHPVGVEVQRLVDGGSAKASGIEVGDVITRIGDHEITNSVDFVDHAKRLHAGDMVTLSVIRGQQTLPIRVSVRPRPYETSPDADVFYRAIDVDDSLRRTIVTVPRTPGRHPAVLFMTGVGCFSQESLDRSTPEAMLLYGLTRRGFLTMRVEKSGMGDSEGPPCNSAAAGLQAEIRAYLAGLRSLEQDPSVNRSEVFLIGHSIGGVEAPMVAKQLPVRGIVVINTVARPFLEYLLETRRRQGQLRHRPYDEIDRQNRLDEWCNHRMLIEREPLDRLLKEDAACRDHVEYPAPSTFMQEWAAVNPSEEWKQVASPVLIVYGTSDYIAAAVDHSYLATMLNSVHPGQATLKAIEQMDHYLTHAVSMEASQSRPANARADFEPAVLDAIAAWLEAQLAHTS
jgi:uncharacterized protein